jgi:two-component system, OmpR family, response regulator ChvI
VKRILIVDDNPDITFFFEKVLNDSGFYVDSYNDPVKLLVNFRTQFYDLIFIDIRMPNVNGFQLFKRLKKKDPQVKVCFITAFESYYNSLREEHPGLNVKCFVRKPIDAEQLLAVVRRETKVDVDQGYVR